MNKKPSQNMSGLICTITEQNKTRVWKDFVLKCPVCLILIYYKDFHYTEQCQVS